jgi:CRISPR-associated protein Cst2
MHTTEYQYSFGLNLGDVIDKRNIGHVIDAIVDLPQVAGNHARFAYDFSPASIILRVTNAHSSKIQNCFEHDEAHRTYTIERLIRRIESGDVSAAELIVGGELASTTEGARLKEFGVAVLAGVKAAANEARKRIKTRSKEFAHL